MIDVRISHALDWLFESFRSCVVKKNCFLFWYFSQANNFFTQAK